MAMEVTLYVYGGANQRRLNKLPLPDPPLGSGGECLKGIQIYCFLPKIYCSLAGSCRILLLFQNPYFPTTRMDWVWDSVNAKWLYMYFIITWAFISSLADKTSSPRKNEQYFYFSLTLRNTEIFSKVTFWSDSWATAPVFHNRFLITNLYLMTVVIHSKQRMAITP